MLGKLCLRKMVTELEILAAFGLQDLGVDHRIAP
jgi:hypothetical protein